MPAHPARVPRELRNRVFRGSLVLADGILTPAQLRARPYRRLFRDVYLAADDEVSIDHRVRAQAACLILPTGAAVARRSALTLAGCPDLADDDDPVDVVTPPDRRFGPVDGLRIRIAAVPAADVLPGPWRRTTPLRSCLDIAREPDLVRAVVALDIALRDRRVQHPELTAAAAELGAARGSRAARTAIALADGRAESPPETRTRLILARAGLHPIPQYVVRDERGGFLARVDLAFLAQRIAVEYEGRWHGDPDQVPRDRQRLNRLGQAGWTVVFVTAPDLLDPAALVARVRAFLAHAPRARLLLTSPSR